MFPFNKLRGSKLLINIIKHLSVAENYQNTFLPQLTTSQNSELCFASTVFSRSDTAFLFVCLLFFPFK